MFMRAYIGGNYSLYGLYARLKGKRHLLVKHATDIVIEGTPRSANSFSFQAFRKAQKGKIRIAHHLHVSCQISQAVKWQLPVILLIRHPVDSIASWVVRHPDLDPETCMFYYYKYYDSLKDYKEKVVIAPFETVISDFGKVIEAVNEKYSKSFDVFHHTKEAQDAIFQERHQANERMGRSKLATPAPSQIKDQFKKEIVPHIKELHITRKAIELYHSFILCSQLEKK